MVNDLILHAEHAAVNAAVAWARKHFVGPRGERARLKLRCGKHTNAISMEWGCWNLLQRSRGTLTCQPPASPLFKAHPYSGRGSMTLPDLTHIFAAKDDVVEVLPKVLVPVVGEEAKGPQVERNDLQAQVSGGQIFTLE